MRVLFVVAFVSASLFVGESSASDVFRPVDLAISQSRIAGVPAATALTDLVSKSTGTSISSGLAQPVNTSLPSIFPSDAFTAPATLALEKGYILRPVELDSRFQANVKRLQSQIDPSSLIPLSNASGAAIDPEAGIELPGTLGKTTTVNIPNVLGQAIQLNIPVASLPTAPVDDAFNLPTIRVASAVEASNVRSIGGTAIPPDHDAFPDAVAIVGNNKLCSGVLVQKDAVLTAAHCFCSGVTDSVLIGTSIISPQEAIKVDVTRSISFIPCEKIATDIGKGDIAILRLTQEAPIPPRTIGDLPMVLNAASVRAVGFGRTTDTIGFKYQVDIVIASYQCDGSAYANIPDAQVYRCSKPFELVAASLNRDTCGGDSGGEIVAFGSDTKPYVVGLTSRSVDPTGKCGPGGIYVLLSAAPIKDWLTANGIGL